MNLETKLYVSHGLFANRHSDTVNLATYTFDLIEPCPSKKVAKSEIADEDEGIEIENGHERGSGW